MIMILRSPASHLQCTFIRRPPLFDNKLFSCAFTTLNHHIQTPEDIVLHSRNVAALRSYEQDDPLNCLTNLSILPEFQRHGILSQPREINKVISTCAKLGSHSIGIQLHTHVIILGFTSNVYINSALVDMYCKCFEVEMAHRLFDEMPETNSVAWNSLISGYLDTRSPGVAIRLFLEMLRVGTMITPHCISAALVCSSQLEDGGLGSQVHGLGLKFGFGSNIVVGTGLVDMYSKCSCIETSRRVFDRMCGKNTRSWTSMITGYAQSKRSVEAMVLVGEMLREGVAPNYVTYNTLLCSFCGPDDLDHCKEIHSRIVQQGFESYSYVAATLVTVYSECGCSKEDFFKICKTIILWDQISWNAVIGGFSNLGIGEDALKCFTKMRRAGIYVDLFTFASILKAAGTILDLEVGRQIHSLVIKGGYESTLCAMNGLISMFSRCGDLADAKKVFFLMDDRDVVSWNSLLSGYAHHGHVEEIVQIFEEMKMSRAKVQPNLTTFLIVLSACSHSGLVEKGLEYFNLMVKDKSIPPPTLEHYTCIIDLCSRAGYLEQAEAFIDSMGIDPAPFMLKALLSACQVYANKEIAIRCARKLHELSPADPATYVVLANIMARDGCWDDAEGVRRLMYDRWWLHNHWCLLPVS